ncbi:MAG: DUF7305 domain-containing protein [Phycisphaeraceae bacterium]
MTHRNGQHPGTNTRRNAHRRGVAVLLTLIALSMATILSLSFIASQSTSTPIAENVQHHGPARMIAESGLVNAVEYVRTDPDWRTERSEGVWIRDAPFEGGTFTIEGYDGRDEDDDSQIEGDGDLADDSSDPVTLIAIGRFEGVTAEVRAELSPGGAGGAGGYGVLTTGTIKLNGNANIDSYDADEGAYWLTKSDDALVATNGTDDDIVKIKGNSRLKGDLDLGTGADPYQALDSNTQSSVTGDIGTLAEPLAIEAPDHNITDPLTSPGISSPFGTTSFGTPGQTTTYHWDELEVGGFARVRIDGPVRALVEGDVDFSSGAKLEIEDEGSVELFVKGKVNVGGHARLNPLQFGGGGDPGKLTIYVIGGEDVTISGNGSVYGTIVMPDSNGKLAGNADLYGGFHGQSLELKGDASLHQDISTAVPNTTTGGTGYSLRWIER